MVQRLEFSLDERISSYEAYLFDMDGLIIDTERLSFEAWHEVAARAGYELTQEIFARIVGTTGEESHRRLRAALGEEFPAEELRRQRTEILEHRIATDGLPIMHGARELLRTLQQLGRKVALVTSTKNPHASARIASAKLQEYFPVVVAGDQVVQLKPAPDLYARACDLLNVAPARAIAFEDSGLGVQAAVAAGVEVVMVPNIYQPTDDDRRRAKAVLASLHELVHQR